MVAVTFSSATVLAENVVVFGATGNIGKKIVREALDRGHTVYGVSRSPDRFEYKEENFVGVSGNPTQLESVTELAAKADSIIVAVGGRDVTDPKETAMNRTAVVMSQVLADRGEEGPQVVIIGGGMTVLDDREKIIARLPQNATEGSPFRALFLGHWEAYQTYLASSINWTFLAPPMKIIGWRGGDDENTRTGKYSVSSDGFVKDAEGNDASIYVADLAVAALDMAESGDYNQLRVTVGNH